MPDTISRTSVWLPNEMARPKTEAPAISGVMLTPKSSSATSTAMRPMTIATAIRSNGIMVLKPRGAGGRAVAVGDRGRRRRPACAPCRDRWRT